MATAVETYREINKVIVAAPRDLEPNQEQCFLAGYSAVTGARFPGEIKYLEVSWTDALEYAKKNGYQLVMVPSGIFLDSYFSNPDYQLALKYYRDYGIQFIIPAGDNYYASDPYTKNLICPIITGAGGDVNATGRRIEFFGPDVAFDTPPDPILTIRKEGTVYNIASISRFSTTSLAVKLTGISNLNTIGFDDHGIPFTLAGLTGTNISPLPANGVYYTTYVGVGSDTLYFNFDTSAGTIGGFQAVSGGTLMFGVNPARLFIKRTRYGLWAVGNVTLAGVTGFQYSPNGTYGIAEEYAEDGFGDKFSIAFNPGTGSAVIKGTAQIQTSSYGNPYVGGVLAALVNYYKITFWKARHILRETSAQGGLYSTANGYGKFNIVAAKEYTGNFTPDPYLYIGNIGTLTGYHTDPENIQLSLPHVENATDFDIYMDDILIDTMPAFAYGTSAIGFTTTLTRRFPSQGKYKFQYRARIEDKQYTAMSNAKYFKCFKATKIAV